ncbi:MAG TPA: hypothetical protein VN999_05620 [Thermoanaerobaculia bacterium]|nr:hypothetical protein [Thermoanaerobaculia bacterium]
MSTTRSRIAPLLPAFLALAAAACAAGGKSGAPPDATAAAPVLSPAAATALIEWRRPAALPGVSPPPAAVPGSRPAAAPAPGAAATPGSVAGPLQWVTIDLGGLWVGPGDPREGPRVHYLFARRRRTEDLAQFVRDYAPFQASQLVFRGRGTVQASAAERRMIGEWTRAVAVEAAGDAGSPSPYGLAFAWHRGAATGGVCDDLVVYLTGEVRAGSCGAGAEVGGRLAGERLQRLYGWVDGLAAFQDAGEQELRAGALLDRLIFAGRGRQRAGPGEIAAIETFAGSLHRELTAAAPAPALEGPAATPIAAAVVPKATLPPPREVPAEAEAAADAEANVSSPPAETVQPPRPPPRPETKVPDEPDEAPPPFAEERPAAATTGAAPPVPGAAPPPPANGASPPRQPPRKRPVNAKPAPTPAPEPPPP